MLIICTRVVPAVLSFPREVLKHCVIFVFLFFTGPCRRIGMMLTIPFSIID